MPATDRFQLVVESISRGEAEVSRFEESINRVGTTVERQKTKFRDFTTETKIAGRSLDEWTRSLVKGAAELYLFEKAIAGGARALRGGVELYTSHRSGLEQVTDAFRALRVVAGSTGGVVTAAAAATTVGIGIAAEQTLKLAAAQAKLIEANNFTVARSPSTSFATLQAYQNLDRFTAEQQAKLFTKRSLAPDVVVDLTKQFQAIGDPLERINFAVKNFGEDAEKVFPILNRRLIANVDSAQDLARALDVDARRSIANFQRDLASFSEVFDGVGDRFRQLKEEAKQGITLRVAAAFDFTRTLSQRLPALPGEEAGTTLDRPSNAGDTIFSQRDLIRESRRDLVRPAAPPRPPADPRLVSAAQSSITAASRTESGIRDALSEERRRLSSLTEMFNLNPNRQGDLATPLLQAAATVRQLEADLKRFDTAGAEKAARQAAQVVEIIAGIGERTPVEEAQLKRLRVLQDLRDNNAVPGQVRQADALLQGEIARRILEEQAPSAARIRAQNLTRFVPEDRSITNAAFDSLALDQQSQAAAKRTAQITASVSETFKDLGRLTAVMQQQAEFEAKRLELLAGPGGEVAALERSVTLRLAAVDAASQMGAILDVQAEKTRILQDRELALLELQQRRREAFRSSIERGFDAAIAGGDGISALVKAQGLGVLRTVAGNIGTEFFSSTAGRLTLPGQSRTVADPKTGEATRQPTLLGRILAGTPFASDDLPTALDRNREAIDRNTDAVNAATTGKPQSTAEQAVTSLLPAPIRNLSNLLGPNPFRSAAEASTVSRNAVPVNVAVTVPDVPPLKVDAPASIPERASISVPRFPQLQFEPPPPIALPELRVAALPRLQVEAPGPVSVRATLANSALPQLTVQPPPAITVSVPAIPPVEFKVPSGIGISKGLDTPLGFIAGETARTVFNATYGGYIAPPPSSIPNVIGISKGFDTPLGFVGGDFARNVFNATYGGGMTVSSGYQPTTSLAAVPNFSFPTLPAATPPGVLPGYTGTAADLAVNRSITGQIGINTPINDKGGFSLGKGVFAAGAIAGGVLGVRAGIQEGGARGALTAGSSAAGAAAALLALSPATGPAAPIVAAVGLGLGLARTFFPDPKKVRDEQLDRLIESARYTAPDPLAYNMDLYGRQFDYNSEGGFRTAPAPVIVQVQAMDSKSFIDHSGDISSAVQFAMENGHAINRTARETVLGGIA